MKRLALHALVFGAVLLGLVLASRELAPKPALAAVHPYIQRYVLAQGVPPAGCGASCSGSTTVFDGIVSASSLMTTGGIPFQGDGTTSTGARLYLGSLNATNAGIWGATSGALIPTSTNYSFLTDNGGSNTYINGSTSVRLRIGTTDFLTQNSGGVSFAGSTTELAATTANLFFSNAGANVGIINSNMSAANATGAIPALRFRPQQALDAADSVVGVQTAAGAANLWTWQYSGQVTIVANPALATCAAGIEGAISRDVLSGVATGKRTKLCLCTSDGAGAYVWQNLATGTLGASATTCGTE